MFSSGPSTPDLKLNLSSPFSRKKTDSKSSPLSPDRSTHDTVTTESTKKISIKNPLKSIKKLSNKNNTDEIDTRDYYSASPNVNLNGSFDNSSNGNGFGNIGKFNSLKTPNISLNKFRTVDNLSTGLETMQYGIFELQKYGIVGSVKSLAFDPNQSLMALVTHFNHVYIFGQARVNVIIKLESVSPIRALKFIKGIYLIAIDSANSIYVISLLSKKVIHTCISKIPITAFASDYSLEFVFVGLKNGTVRAFNIESGVDTILNLRKEYQKGQYDYSPTEVCAISIQPRDFGTLLISYPKETVVYNLAENAILQSLVYGIPKTAPGGENSMYDYSREDEKYYPKTLHNVWHPNGLHCLTVYDDNSIVFWDAKTGEKILARTLFDVEVDQPTGKTQKINKNRMTKIKTIKWLCEENPEKTSLLILGGDGYSNDGYHQLVRMNFGKMVSYSLSSYQYMSQYYSQPKEQRIFAIHSNSSIVDFVPFGESSPYFDGCHNAKLIAVIMNDGSIKFLHYPEGKMSMNAKYFPSTVSWLNPKITCSSSSFLDKSILNSMTTVRHANDFPDSILKGGIPCRPKFKADIGSLILTGHENGFIRLWNSSEGDLDSSNVFEIDISAILQKDDESVTVMKVSFASQNLEVACSLQNGDVLIFNYQMNKNYNKKNELNSNFQSLSLENSGKALINIQDRTPTNFKKGFIPKLLIKPLNNGIVTSVQTCNLGIVAIGYSSGRILLIDRRTGTVIHNEILKDKGLSIPIQATSIEFGYGIHSKSNERGVVVMYIGTNIGRLLTYEILGLPGSFRVNFVEQIDSNDDLIDTIIVINSISGRPVLPTVEHFKRDISQDRSYPYIITSSKSDIRIIKNNSKISHKTFNKGDVTKIGITGAKTMTSLNVSFCLVVILGISRNILSLTLPTLVEISNLRIPYRVEPNFCKESSILPLGDVFIRIAETEAALVNIMNLRKPVMSLETNRSSDTLFLKNIAVPWRPGSNPMLKSTPNLTYPQLYLLLTGHDLKTNKNLKSEEEKLSWETSCYNSANYNYISTSKPIYYNPNAIHQDTKLMETPKPDITKKKYAKEGGWFDDITKYASDTIESAQGNVDSYLDDMNNDIDKMITDAKHDAMKGLISGKFL